MIRACTLLILWMVAPAWAFGQAQTSQSSSHPNVARGFDPTSVFEVGEIDQVNLFNGNLSLTIPIGQRVPVGANLSYGLSLIYNAKAWEWVTECDTSIDEFPRCVHLPKPFLEGNAGLGWNLSLGRLEGIGGGSGSIFRYESPDGGTHFFYATLHPGEISNGNVFYTRDGSYLRVAKAGSEWDLSFPDGTIHRFGSTGRLKSIRDPFSNNVTVTQSANEWTLSDRHRSNAIVITLVDVPLTVGIGDANESRTVKVVDTVVAKTFGGRSVVYDFDYRVTTVERPAPFRESDTMPVGIPNYSPTFPVPLLTRVRACPGSCSGSGPSDNSLWSYEMPMTAYNTTRANGGDFATGLLAELTVPTRGKIAWTYMPYVFPDAAFREPPGPMGGGDIDFEWLRSTPGIATRSVKTAGGSTLGTWRYSQHLDQSNQLSLGNGTNAVEMWREVTNPLGNRTRHYFAATTPIEIGAQATDAWQYGLPFSLRQGASGSGSKARFRSREIFEGNTLVRQEWVRYERDHTTQNRAEPPTPTASVELDINRRVVYEYTDFRDSSNFADTLFSEFDGLGNYRRRTMDGNFPGQNARVERTDFNPGSGTYVVNANLSQGGDFSLPSESLRWILGDFDETWQLEGGVRATQTHCFDGDGFLTRRRLHKATGGATGGQDVVVSFNRDNRGNVTSERYHGGDLRGGVGAGNLCSNSLPAADYELQHKYAFGVRRETAYAAGGTPLGFKVLDLEIDQNTGLPGTSRDTAGVATTFEYDALGRQTKISPSDDAFTELIYRKATGPGALARVQINQKVGGTFLSMREIWFEDFGRLWQERVRHPTDWTRKDTEYNALGLVTRTSEPRAGTNTPTHWTRFSDFDAFGRPEKTTRPDGSEIREIRIGTRYLERRVKVATSGTGIDSIGQTEQVTISNFDRFERLRSVSEPSGGATATYSYDVGNRLTRADLTGSGTTQVREFVYDQRGFLRAERHPEVGVESFGGWIRHAGFDARGHAESRTVDGAAGYELLFTYDKAERLRLMREGSSGRTLKEFVYADRNVGFDRRGGKLYRTVRHNWRNVPWDPGTVEDIQVTEDYQFRGQGGRVSSRTTSVAPLGETFTQSWTWNDLGLVDTLTYPRCTHSGCVGSTPSKEINPNYDFGFLNAVPGYATSIGYHPSGLVASVNNVGGLNYRVDPDPHGMGRPLNIRLEGSITTELGIHRYDGAGNLTTRGAEWYIYDGVSRLKQVTLGSSARQRHDYDRFGNLTRTITTGTLDGGETRSFGVDSRRNRLSASVYDARGNLLLWGNEVYHFDDLDKLAHRNFPETTFVYTADDERVATLHYESGDAFARETWTLRDLGNQVLTTYEHVPAQSTRETIFQDGVNLGSFACWDVVEGNTNGNGFFCPTPASFEGQQGTWTWDRDYVYRDGVMLAADTDQPAPKHRHIFAPDHLGSSRVTADANGALFERHTYFGFGEQRTDASNGQERLRFTGHERDFGAPGFGDDLDYMHARYYNVPLGRFLSIDPVLGTPESPQSWNRYAYVQNNPLNAVDPDGKALETILDVAFVASDVADIVRSVQDGTGVSTNQLLTLGGDLLGAVIPGLPGLGRGAKTFFAKGGDTLGGKAGKRPGRGRFRRGIDSSDQFEGVTKKQRMVRQGTADGVIDSTKGSKRREKNDFARIKSTEDAKREFGEEVPRIDRVQREIKE